MVGGAKGGGGGGGPAPQAPPGPPLSTTLNFINHFSKAMFFLKKLKRSHLDNVSNRSEETFEIIASSSYKRKSQKDQEKKINTSKNQISVNLSRCNADKQ